MAIVCVGGVILFCGVGCGLLAYVKPPTPAAEIDPDHGAAGAAMLAVKSRLKSPSTAEFAHSREFTVTRLPGNRYRVSGYVDSQNSFGAMIRTHWTAELEFRPEHSGEEWLLVDIHFVE